MLEGYMAPQHPSVPKGIHLPLGRRQQGSVNPCVVPERCSEARKRVPYVPHVPYVPYVPYKVMFRTMLNANIECQQSACLVRMIWVEDQHAQAQHWLMHAQAQAQHWLMHAQAQAQHWFMHAQAQAQLQRKRLRHPD